MKPFAYWKTVAKIYNPYIAIFSLFFGIFAAYNWKLTLVIFLLLFALLMLSSFIVTIIKFKPNKITKTAWNKADSAKKKKIIALENERHAIHAYNKASESMVNAFRKVDGYETERLIGLRIGYYYGEKIEIIPCKHKTGVLVNFGVIGGEFRPLSQEYTGVVNGDCLFYAGEFSVKIENYYQYTGSVPYPEGYGHILFTSGDRYYGEVVEGRIDTGCSVYYFNDGRKYYGGIIEGKAHSFGIIEYTDGSCYAGEWKDGKRNGYGVEYSSDKKPHRIGKWENDAFCKQRSLKKK